MIASEYRWCSSVDRTPPKTEATIWALIDGQVVPVKFIPAQGVWHCLTNSKAYTPERVRYWADFYQTNSSECVVPPFNVKYRFLVRPGYYMQGEMRTLEVTSREDAETVARILDLEIEEVLCDE